MSDTTQTMRFNIEAKVPGGTDTLENLRSVLENTGVELSNLKTTFIGFDGATRTFNHSLELQTKNAQAYDAALRSLGAALGQLKQVERNAFDPKNENRLKTPYTERTTSELAKNATEALNIARQGSKDKLAILSQDIEKESTYLIEGGASKLAINKRYAAMVKEIYFNLGKELNIIEKKMVDSGIRTQDALYNSPEAQQAINRAQQRILSLASSAGTAITTGKADKLGLTNAIANMDSYLAQLKTDMDADIRIHQYGADTIKGIEERRRKDIVKSRRETNRELAELKRELMSLGVVTPDTEIAYHIKASTISGAGKDEQDKINARAKAEKDVIEKEKQDLEKREAQIDKFNTRLIQKYLADYGHRRAAAISGEDSIRTAIADAEAKILVSTNAFEAKRDTIEENWRNKRYSSWQKFNADLDKIYKEHSAERNLAIEEIKSLRDRQTAHKNFVNEVKKGNKELLMDMEAIITEEDVRIKSSNNQRAVALAQLASKESSIRRRLADELSALEKKAKNDSLLTAQTVAAERANIERKYLDEIKKVRAEILALESKEKKTTSYNANLLEQIQHYSKIYLILGSIHATMGQIRKVLGEIPKAGIELEATFSSLMATMGSPTEATKQLEFLREEAKRTGIPLENLRETWRNFSASTKLSGESTETTKRIFTNLNTAMVTLHMSGDKVSHTFLAISQMFNKGKIQSEELVKQLANYIPGAFGSFALATGRTTAQLSADMKKGLVSAHKEIDAFTQFLAQRFGGDAFTQARAGLQAAIGDYKTSVLSLEEAIFVKLEKSGKATLRTVTSLVDKLTESVKDIDTFSSAIGNLEGALTSLAGVIGGALVGGALIRLTEFLRAPGIPGVVKLAGALTALAVGGLTYTAIQSEGAAKNLEVFGSTVDDLTVSIKRYNEGKQIDVKSTLDTLSQVEEISKKRLAAVPARESYKPSTFFSNLQSDAQEQVRSFKEFYEQLGDTIVIGETTIAKKDLEASNRYTAWGRAYKQTLYHDYFAAVSEALAKEKEKFQKIYETLPDTSKEEQGALWEMTGMDEKTLAAFDRTANKTIEQLKLKLDAQYEAVKAKQDEIRARAKADREGYDITQIQYENTILAANKAEGNERLRINGILAEKIKLLQRQKELLTPSMKSEEARSSSIPEAVRFAESGLSSPYGTPTTGKMLNPSSSAYGAWQITKGTWETFLNKDAKFKEIYGEYQDNLNVLLSAEGKSVGELTDVQKKVMERINVVGTTILEGYIAEFKDIKSALVAYKTGKPGVDKYYEEKGINKGEITPEQSDKLVSDKGTGAYVQSVLKSYADRAILSKTELGTLVLQTEQERLQLDTAKAISEESKKDEILRAESLRLNNETAKAIKSSKLSLASSIEILKESPESEIVKYEKEHAKTLDLINKLRESGNAEEKITAEELDKQYQLGLKLAGVKGTMLDLEKKLAEKNSSESFKQAMIAEKEKSGNLSTWEAMKERDKLNETHKKNLRLALEEARRTKDTLEKEGKPVPERVSSDIEKWNEEFQILQERSSETAQFIRDNLQSSFADSFKDFVTGAKSGEQAIRSFAASVLESMAQIMANQIAKSIMSAAFNVATSSLGGTSVGNFLGLSAKPSAKGNVFTNGSITPFASGGIVSSPTLFPMSQGHGLMGEAGPEAIMPLKRDKSGRLGVSGGSTNVVNNNVNNISVTIEKYTGNDNPEATAAKIAEAISRKVAREELTKANRSGNMLRPITAF